MFTAVVVVVPRLPGGIRGHDSSPRLGAWRAIAAGPLAARISASVVWSGRELLVWRGRGCVRGRCDDQGAATFADGAAFDPGTETWRTLAPSPLSPRSGAMSAWSGREMLVWGGTAASAPIDGAAFDPAADRWRPLAPGPLGGGALQAVWSGREMLVWAGAGGPASASATPVHDGAAYDPAADQWRSLSPAPLAGRLVRGSWTGRELLIWGGEGPGPAQADGAAYDPAADSWRRIGSAPLAPRRGFAEVWTGRELLVWGGAGATGSSVFGDGAAYDPVADGWRSIARWPGRFIPAAVWTGGEMLVAGGIGPSPAGFGIPGGVEAMAEGARYDPGRSVGHARAAAWRPGGGSAADTNRASGGERSRHPAAPRRSRPSQRAAREASHDDSSLVG